MIRTAFLRSKSRLTGRIVNWEPFHRKGSIVAGDGQTYFIASATSFSSFMPTEHRSLAGHAVTFAVVHPESTVEDSDANCFFKEEREDLPTIATSSPLPFAIDIELTQTPRSRSQVQMDTAAWKRDHDAALQRHKLKFSSASLPQFVEFDKDAAQERRGVLVVWNMQTKTGKIALQANDAGEETVVDLESAAAIASSLPSPASRDVMIGRPVRCLTDLRTALDVEFLDIDEAVKDPDGGRVRKSREEGILGIVLRWSGGQGTVEDAEGRLFAIEDATKINDLFDPQNAALRGAVVTFTAELDTTQASSFAGCASQVSIVAFPSDIHSTTSGNKATSSTNKEDNSAVEGDRRIGTVASWSKAERQGVVVDLETKQRFVIRNSEVIKMVHVANEEPSPSADADNHDEFSLPMDDDALSQQVVSTIRRRLSANTFPMYTDVQNETGKRASNGMKIDAVVVFVAPADGRKIARNIVCCVSETDENTSTPKPQSDAEAVSSPLAESYWAERYKELGGSNLDAVEADKELKPATPIDAALENDSWSKDPKKNFPLPTNKNVKYLDHLKATSPLYLMQQMATAATNPAETQKQIAKLESRLPDHVREQNLKRAKEETPKLMKVLDREKRKFAFNQSKTFF